MSSYRKYKVIKKVFETGSIASFYLEPTDGFPPEAFKPGQHLLFKISLPGNDIPVFRYYSFSESFNHKHYRISVKKEPPPKNCSYEFPGLVSTYLCEKINEGDVLEARGPLGAFHLPATDTNPVVLLAGGIGITPLLSMAKSTAAINPERKVHFLYGVNNSAEHAFAKELNDLKKDFPGLSLTTFYSYPLENDLPGVQHDYDGFIDFSVLQEDLFSNETCYYICGPGAMMDYIKSKLKGAGVDDGSIHTESFTSSAGDEHDDNSAAENDEADEKIKIVFEKSNKTLEWDNRYRSLLEFAESNDIYISSGCLFGDCGTCLTKVTGQVKYIHPTMVKTKEGECLPCSCTPAESILINA
jgi:uncharacterized protein